MASGKNDLTYDSHVWGSKWLVNRCWLHLERLGKQLLGEIQKLFRMIGDGFLAAHGLIKVQSLLDTKVPCQVSGSLDDKLDTFQIGCVLLLHVQQGKNEPQEAKGALPLYWISIQC